MKIRALSISLAAASTSTPSASTPFAAAWLRHRSLDWAADLLRDFPGPAPGAAPIPSHSQENLP